MCLLEHFLTWGWGGVGGGGLYDRGWGGGGGGGGGTKDQASTEFFRNIPTSAPFTNMNQL